MYHKKRKHFSSFTRVEVSTSTIFKRRDLYRLLRLTQTKIEKKNLWKSVTNDWADSQVVNPAGPLAVCLWWNPNGKRPCHNLQRGIFLIRICFSSKEVHTLTPFLVEFKHEGLRTLGWHHRSIEAFYGIFLHLKIIKIMSHFSFFGELSLKSFCLTFIWAQMYSAAIVLYLFEYWN